MAKGMKWIWAVSTSGCLLFFALYCFFDNKALLGICITFGVFAYHFGMRLAVGGLIHSIFHNRINFRRRWFQTGKLEARLYALLRVRQWARYLPTYSPDTFSPQLHDRRELVMATCQAEIVHECIALLSFLPLALIPFFGARAVFWITSVLSALLDLSFVALQRCNRPRLIASMERWEMREKR